ncbi:MAG: zinc metallopeptidase [Tenericutes bacterium]|jgi:Zn-dependent membrane protease YugP|nr:zinc metallopeptidase [Mycoplasmatota bacterium]
MNDFILNEGLIILGLIISLGAQIFVKSTYNKYRVIDNNNKKSGFEIAKEILEKNNIKDIHIIETKGILTDHYDPVRKTVKLSTEVFNDNSIASTSISAHEIGHVLQHKQGYQLIKIRNGVLPLAIVGNKFGYIAILLGLIMGYINLVWLGIALIMLVLLFQLVTLPVELNASSRAQVQLQKLSLIDEEEKEGVNVMLKAAAFTYIASLLTTILQLLRLIILAGNQRDK